MASQHTIEAPLADDDSDSAAWSPWIQIPIIGGHGFDVYALPGTNSGLVRLQCTNGETVEEAEKNAHEVFRENMPCSPHNWFRVNTVRSESQTAPITLAYWFAVK